MGAFLTLIIGGAMLYGLFTVISRERAKEDKKPIGFVTAIIIVIVVILIWGLFSKI
jgi:drug/metabolite transporter (DMT)-like permease